jgi:hypothetical protein
MMTDLAGWSGSQNEQADGGSGAKWCHGLKRHVAGALDMGPGKAARRYNPAHLHSAWHYPSPARCDQDRARAAALAM